MDAPDYYKHLLVVYVDGIKWSGCKIENKIGVLDGSYKGKEMNLYQFIPNKWAEIYFFVGIPKDVPEGKSVSLSLWNTGKRESYADDVSFELYK
jgi:hypothetical protein